MNKEAIDRIVEAEKYKKLAIKALLPEKTAVHLDVINKEINEMLMEFATDIVKNSSTNTSNEKDSADNSTKNKKVIIE